MSGAKIAELGVSPCEKRRAADARFDAEAAEIADGRRFAVHENSFDRTMAGGDQSAGSVFPADEHIGMKTFDPKRSQIIRERSKVNRIAPGMSAFAENSRSAALSSGLARLKRKSRAQFAD